MREKKKRGESRKGEGVEIHGKSSIFVLFPWILRIRGLPNQAAA